MRILLVDDEPNIREALSEFLTTINQNKVVTAGSGEEALALFEPDAFDCAFLDLKMPGMDGIGLLSRIKELDQALPVVVMTGFPSLDAAVDTMRQGASDFLIKPFSLQQVKASLERVVREQRLLRENLRLNEELKQKEKIEELNQELERRIKYQNTIHQISEKIDRLQSSEELYQGIADMAAYHLASAKVAVLLLDRSSNQLLVISCARPSGQRGGTHRRNPALGHLRQGGPGGRTHDRPARPGPYPGQHNGAHHALPLQAHQNQGRGLRGDAGFRQERQPPLQQHRTFSWDAFC